MTNCVGTKFAIRLKGTKRYLPEPMGRMGRGGSHLEPASPEVFPIRLFNTERGAKIALNAWLQGKWVAHRGKYADTPNGPGEYYEEIDIIPQPHRKAELMEIVPINFIPEF